MSALGTLVLDEALRHFTQYKAIAERAVDQLSDEQLHECTSDVDNSVAVTMQHIAGNQRSRWTDFLASDGEKPWRARDAEFEDQRLSRDELFARWNEGWDTLFKAIKGLQPSDLVRDIQIRGESMPAWRAIQRQLTHYAYHVGQIVTRARQIKGADWQTLSVARGASSTFNQSMGYQP